MHKFDISEFEISKFACNYIPVLALNLHQVYTNRAKHGIKRGQDSVYTLLDQEDHIQRKLLNKDMAPSHTLFVVHTHAFC